MNLNPEIFMRFKDIEIDSREFTIRKLLKELSKTQDVVDKYEATIEQYNHDSKQVIDNLMSECAERAIDHFASKEIDFLEEVKMVIGKTILGKPTKATLMEALKKISDLVDNEMDEIEKGNTWTAEQERPADEQAPGKE